MAKKPECGHCDSCSTDLHQIRKNDLKQRSKKILEMLNSGSLSFNEIVELSGFNRKLVTNLLKYLLVTKKVNRIPELSNGARGRPRIFYSAILTTNQQKPKHPSTVAVEVDFEKLQKACKHEKGRNCKQKIGVKCAPSKCPLVLHIRVC